MRVRNFEIVEARDSDVPALVLLLAELFSIETDFRPDAAAQSAGLRRLLARSGEAAVLVARGSGDRILGMVTVQLVVSTAQGGYSAWIEDVIVGRDARRSGIGRALVDAALDWARHAGATRAQLLVDTDNAPAIAFYGALGWHTTRLAARRMLLRRG